MEKWPNLFIVGAPRTGTTTLYDILKRVADIHMSPLKEPNYFSSFDKEYLLSISDKRIVVKKEEYLNLFKDAKNEKFLGEATTQYLRNPKVPKLIHEKSPNAKIIIILRNPIERAFSHYLLRVSRGQTFSFSEAIKMSIESKDIIISTITRPSFYAKDVSRYVSTFGSDNVKVLIFEEFIKETEKTINEVLIFLGIESESPKMRNLLHNKLTRPRNKLLGKVLRSKLFRSVGKKLPSKLKAVIIKDIISAEIEKKPEILYNDIKLLKELFSKDVKELEQILNHKIGWKWFENT